MNKVDGLWEDVLVGFFVQDKKGKWWQVTDSAAGGVGLIDKDGKTGLLPQPSGHKAVTYMYDPKTLIERTLDGKEIR